MGQKGKKGTYLIALRTVFTTAKMSIGLSIGVAPFYRFPINRTKPHIPCIGTAQPPFPDFIQEIDYQTIIKTARSW
jgi:hypothetical protein